MDIQPQAQQSMSDDQELAKVLAGVGQANDNDFSSIADDTIVTTPAPAIVEPAAGTPEEVIVPAEEPVVADPMSAASAYPSTFSDTAAPSGDLEGIKKDALVELRPLVDKLDLAPEEKFDTYLLLLRSTDDRELIAPAHEAAKAITDESRRAQALLDIIKEIDFLSGQQVAA